jgi:hypothetical protein
MGLYATQRRCCLRSSSADDLNYYKVEKWTNDGTKVDRMLYAGSDLNRALDVFTAGDQVSAAHTAYYFGSGRAFSSSGRRLKVSVPRPRCRDCPILRRSG